jgi:Membrane-bound toxin component of toxin-antitoxin system
LIQTLTVSLRPSRVLALSLTITAGTALTCAWISLPLLAFPLVAAGIALAWAWHLAQTLQWGAGTVRALELAAKGDARWQDGSGQWHEVEILPGSYVSDWLVVVNLGAGGARGRSLVLLPDSAVVEELRRLRVWLRWRLGRP